jgi:Family of unknown function (DUF6459)
MSSAASTTHHMQQIPPPQLPARGTDIPAAPTVIPTLPTRLQQPGRRAPLPDAVAIRSCAVPTTSPPFDDEDSHSGNGAVDEAAGRPPDEDQPGLDSVASDPPAPDHDESDRQRLGPPAGWPSQFAQVVAETLAGSRPARQLTPWTTEQARRRIRQLGPMLTTDQRPKVRRVMTSAPAAGVLEMTAVVGFGPRIRVLALRLELDQPRPDRGGTRWCCTAIESA